MLRTRIAKVAAVSSLVVAAALASPVVTLRSAADAVPAYSVLAGDAGWQIAPADAGRLRHGDGVPTREVREEFLTFAPGGPQTAENMAASRPLNQDLLGRGVRMRTIYLDSVRSSRPTVEHATWLARLGGRIRTIPSLPTRMILMDRRTAMISVSSDDTAAGAVLLTGQGTLTALYALFETTWEAARPLGEVVPTDPNGLTGQQATALRLLAEGHTDEAIAKRLGVSHRTARRIASELMDRLGARSRFEAGARAVQQGWLPARS
ncbi:helix-turn-helix transcriptional regulator [Streptomyces sp. NBC_00358]|jgi:DNA-binding CsgD family transcriptional regulator|uniref:helix-turn-helix transcriptional regulator n=1 Tax=Streptomyces sp. NBC_00358 TaxID=2975725 RepID=UPI002E26AB5D